MDSGQQIEEIIREIAVKHGIAVSHDDPILILQTMNNRLLKDSAKAQQEMLDRFKEELEAMAVRWGNDARERAERILGASLEASKEVQMKMTADMARAATENMAKEIDSALLKVVVPVQDAYRVAILNIVAASITLAAAAVALWTVLR